MQSDSITVRRATIDDAAEACAVIRSSISDLCYLDHRGDQQLLEEWLSNKTVENVRRRILQSHFFVAEEAGTILGVGAMLNSGKITANYVAPTARFRGVSKALIHRLEETAKSLGIEKCILESSQTALRFYYALGYVDSGEIYILPLTGTIATVLSKELL